MAWEPGSLPSCPSPPFYKETVSGLAPAPPSVFSSPPPQFPLAKSLTSSPTMRVNELNKKIQISFAPIRRCTKCFHGLSLREGGQAQARGRTEKANRRSKEALWAFLSPTPQRVYTCSSQTVPATQLRASVASVSALPLLTSTWVRHFLATPMWPRLAPSTLPSVYPSVHICIHQGQDASPRPLAAPAQHLVDGRVDHHPSDDLCLVGHLRLLLEGWRDC